MRFFRAAKALDIVEDGLGVFEIDSVSITKNYEFRRLYRKGRSYVNSAIVIYFLKNRKGINRIGITTSRKIGKAVMRNRARRIIREAYRSIEGQLPQGYDFIFVARTKTCLIKEQDLLHVLRGIFTSANMLK